MTKIAWAPRALRDTREAWNYIATDNEEAADRVFRLIQEAGESLALFPKRGRRGKARGSRELNVQGTRYFIVYRVGRSGIEIARVVHGARDWPPKG